MKYAHLADLHLGSWKEEKMRDLSNKSFIQAIDNCLQQQVDFIIFAGDIFNTSLPSIDTLKLVTEKLRKLKENRIPAYVIAGSHDFSPSGRTMIEVLEKAGLVINVCQGKINPENQELELSFTIDQKTGVKLTGIIGRKGLLDKTYYLNLAKYKLEQEPGYKIFLFHTTVSELVPAHLTMIEAQPASFFPHGFNYYAGGHIHHPTQVVVPDIGLMTYPGALFPNNFAELEKYSHGGYFLITVKNHQQEVIWQPLPIINLLPIQIARDFNTPQEIEEEILAQTSGKTLKDSIITIRLSGSIKTGRISDINFNKLFQHLYQQGTYFVLKNTCQLYSQEFKEIKIAEANPEIIEDNIIKEHLQQIKVFDQNTEFFLTKSLLSCLNTSRKEGENTTDFNQRIEQEIKKILKI